MTNYVLRTISGAIPTLLLLVLLVVVLVRLIPGSAVDAILTESSASAEDREEFEHQLGLDRSIPEQYVRYLFSVVDGSLGRSLYDGREVSSFITSRSVPTLQLAFMSLCVSSVLGITIGVISAVRRNTPFDYLLRFTVNLSLGIPSFVVATAIVLLPAYYFEWTPPLGYVSFFEDPIGNITFFIAPVLTLGLSLSASVARITRTATLEVLHLDYIRTARAKGLDERNVIFRHVMRNSLLPVLTLIGLQVAFLISGTVIIESVFSIPGLGTVLLQKIRERDYPVVQGLVLAAGFLVIGVNMAVDILYGYVNPRLRAR